MIWYVVTALVCLWCVIALAINIKRARK